jgi:hypothetical protein
MMPYLRELTEFLSPGNLLAAAGSLATTFLATADLLRGLPFANDSVLGVASRPEFCADRFAHPLQPSAGEWNTISSSTT